MITQNQIQTEKTSYNEMESGVTKKCLYKGLFGKPTPYNEKIKVRFLECIRILSRDVYRIIGDEWVTQTL